MIWRHIKLIERSGAQPLSVRDSHWRLHSYEKCFLIKASASALRFVDSTVSTSRPGK
jgi:hypothetical protein